MLKGQQLPRQTHHFPLPGKRLCTAHQAATSGTIGKTGADQHHAAEVDTLTWIAIASNVMQ
jgi:hypothetical protein